MLFTFKNVSCLNKQKYLLHPFSLSIPLKTNVCITGPSGSGKTTFLRLFNRMTLPTAGEIHYQNKPVSNLDVISYRRKAIMIFQEPVLLPGTVQDNLMLPFQMKRWEREVSNEELTQICELCELPSSLLAQDSQTLSGGEKQRVAIGRALLVKPEVLLMDEPTSALDIKTAKTIMTNITKTLPDLTLIVVSHAKELMDFCGMQVKIEDGKVS